MTEGNNKFEQDSCGREGGKCFNRTLTDGSFVFEVKGAVEVGVVSAVVLVVAVLSESRAPRPPHLGLLKGGGQKGALRMIELHCPLSLLLAHKNMHKEVDKKMPCSRDLWGVAVGERRGIGRGD